MANQDDAKQIPLPPLSRQRNLILGVLCLLGGISSFVWAMTAPNAWGIVVACLLTAVLITVAYIQLKPFLLMRFPEKRIKSFFVILAGVFGVVIALVQLASPREEAEATMETCIDAIDFEGDEESAMVDQIYCQTEYANIWKPEAPEMLTTNKELAVQHFPRFIAPALGSGEPAPLEESMADGSEANVGYKMSRIYERWPEYGDRPFLVLGGVMAKDQLAKDDTSSEWVLQLGTVRDQSKVMYVKLVRPPEWTPPRAEECPQALAEIIPIARGYVPSAVADHSLDAVYGLGTSFTCLDVSDQEIEEFTESMTPEEREAFEEGTGAD